MSQLSLYVNEHGKCVTHYSGFSWLAGIVPVVWALQRRLYRVAVLFLIYSVGISVLTVQMGGGALSAVYLAQVIVFGAFSNRLHRMLLEGRGWLLTAEESAPPSGDEA